MAPSLLAEVVTTTGALISVRDYLESTYGYYAHMAWPAVAILCGFIVFFRLVSALSVRFINWQSR